MPSAPVVQQAIARSVSHNEIVHVDVTPDELDELLIESEDSCDLTHQYGYHDVWGVDDAGHDWRLHARVTS